VPLDLLFTTYLSHLERKGRDQKTVARNRYSLARLNSWLAETGNEPKDATEPLLEEYVAWLWSNYAENTTSREVAHIKAAYRYAVRLGAIVKSPAANLECPKVSEVEPAVFSNDELRQIRAAIKDDLEEMVFYCLADSGLRRAELCSLTWPEDAEKDRNGNPINAVDLPKRIITVRGKGGKIRKVPIHPCLAEVLAAAHKRGTETPLGRGGSMRNVNYRLERLLERGGLRRQPSRPPLSQDGCQLSLRGGSADGHDRPDPWVVGSVDPRPLLHADT
jgi:site-specific recombinase XerD